MNSKAEWMKILDDYANFLGDEALKKLHIHLSGIEYGPKGERNHLMLREADIKYRDLLRALYDIKASGRIVCESPTQEDDALLMQRAWRRLASRPKTKTQD